MGIREDWNDKILVFDGGMGSLLQGAGLKPGELPETWNIKHPEVLVKIHEDYLNAGANIILSNTFGANRLKYNEAAEFNLDEIVDAAMKNARTAVEHCGRGYVALDLGPTGRLLKPMGDLDFEEAVSIYTEVVKAGVRGGADLILIETMSDTYELKAAVLAAKENRREVPGHSQFRVPESRAGHCAPSHGSRRRRSDVTAPAPGRCSGYPMRSGPYTGLCRRLLRRSRS